jgi:competence protein ComEC
MKYYGFLILLALFSFYRVYTVCGIALGQNSCLITERTPESADMFTTIRQKFKAIADASLPSPHSELLLGMTIGLDELAELPLFKQALKNTGTVHVVVVSGFNISLVFGMVTGLLGSKYKLKNLLIAQIVTLFYALLSGFNPPVIRAWIMGSTAAWGKYYGRTVDGMRLLLFSGLIMIAISPAQLFSLSFQLSFLATLSLILYGGFFLKIIPYFSDLASTLSAQVLVWPLISYSFGTVSLISPVVNMLILWTVPLSTVLGGVLLILGFVNIWLSRLVGLFLFPFLDFFVQAVFYFATLNFSFVSYEISLKFLVVYYALALFLGVRFEKKFNKSG